MKKIKLTPDEYVKESKNYNLAFSFLEFCLNHPELRFWQALTAWTGKDITVGGADPFYWTKKNK
jgi:hypothetical protein